jgi:hypothetical protein
MPPVATPYSGTTYGGTKGDTGMPDGWRTNPGDPMEQQRQRQRLAMGTLA